MSTATRKSYADQHATESIFWVIEKSGTHRQVWGTYNLDRARAECGTRHTVICGSGLTNGLTMSAGEINAAVASGRIWTIDGETLD